MLAVEMYECDAIVSPTTARTKSVAFPSVGKSGLQYIVLGSVKLAMALFTFKRQQTKRLGGIEFALSVEWFQGDSPFYHRKQYKGIVTFDSLRVHQASRQSSFLHPESHLAWVRELQ